ncbi:hypothetical protein RJ639_014227 [Escallonia herrerae]|uniref:Uncharacterized protein n=1 Tax=Escallonia herrerae TaxID=1293975 RepID=A0AA88USP9_9ASTE|nr:hypothetical protein RJ639_025296 [Escallonia herrerae]KAK3008115.1 hypothetical protein RJ639_014227 [Escallonia herrerae]
MEGVSTRMYRGLTGYWRRRGYERLGGSGRRKGATRVELGSPGSNRRRRFWRIKITPRIKLRFSPRRFFTGLRDAYVRMMLRLAQSGAVGHGVGFAGNGIGGFGAPPIKEYDEKRIVEIYKALVLAQGQLVPRDAARIRSQICLATVNEDS